MIPSATIAALIVLVAAAPCRAQGRSGTLEGRVVDAASGASLARVLVADEESGRAVLTGADGRFTITLPVGRRHLYVSVIGYVLVRREITVTVGTATITIPLTGGTGTYTENITVTADARSSPDSAVPSRQFLDSADIQSLRGVLADDPLRAVQVLPGASTGDDLRSEFSVRGSDFAHLDFTVDGFSTPFLLHTVRAVEDHSSSGSVAMINSDILSDVTLLNGGYAQHSGNRTGAALSFRLREGSRDRTELRGAVSGTSVSAVGEGPLGRTPRGSWLISGRYSYLDHLIHRLTGEEGLTFGFSDVQAKLVWDLTPHQRAEVTVIAGRSRLAEPSADVNAGDLFSGRNSSGLAIAGWRLTGARSVVSAGVLGSVNTFRNDSIEDINLDRGRDTQLTVRIEGSTQLSRRLQLDAGALTDWTRELRTRQRPSGGLLTVINDYSGDATRTGGYAAVRWAPVAGLTLSPGVRVDRWTLIDDVKASPWLQAEWRMGPATSVRAGAGVYRQAPDFEEVLGAWAAADPRLERAMQIDAGVEWRPRTSTRFQITLFDRQDADFIRRAASETRVVATRLVRGTSSARFDNRLDGFARGVEVLAHVRNPNGFTGWIAYSYGRNRYHDVVSGETFWGDLDQRHALNLYAGYRLNARTSVAAKLRMGTNFPVPGYYRKTEGHYFVTDTKNGVRLPPYARLDLRANRTFNWSRRRLTLFAELINALDRENVRYSPPSIDSRTREARGLFESMIPIIPSAGALIEF